MKEGDIVQIKTSEGKFTGTVIPSFDDKILLLKLETGYNVGVEKRKIIMVPPATY